MITFKQRKTISLLTICTIISSCLWGCKDTSMSQISTIPHTKAEETMAQDKVLTITAPYESLPMRSAIEELVNAYEIKYLGEVHIDVEFVPLDKYRKELSMRMENEEQGDIIICENSIMPALIDMGVLQDINDYIEQTNMMSGYNLNMWSNTRCDGKIYGMPFISDPYVMYYNKKIFDEKGQVPPVTWQEFLSVAQNVSMKSSGTYAFGFGALQSVGAANIYLQMLYSMGGSLRAINDENGMKVFELLEALRKKELIAPESINWSEVDAAAMFARGEIAIMFNKLSAYTLIEDKSAYFEVGITTIPYDQKETYLYFGDNIGITEQANYDLAIDFLNFAVQKDTLTRLVAATGTIPIRSDIDYENMPEYSDITGDYVTRQSEYGIAKSSYNLWFNISDAICQGIQRIITDNPPDIQSIANEMQDKVRISIVEN